MRNTLQSDQHCHFSLNLPYLGSLIIRSIGGGGVCVFALAGFLMGIGISFRVFLLWWWLLLSIFLALRFHNGLSAFSGFRGICRRKRGLFAHDDDEEDSQCGSWK